MPSFTGSRNSGYRYALVAVVLLLLVALSAVLVLSMCGCGEKKTVETSEEGKETNGEVEKEKEEPSNSKVEEDGETVVLDWEYTNDMFGFSISYPEDWECNDILEGHGCSITRPTNGIWQVDAFSQPAEGKTPLERLEQEYTMMTEQWEVGERDPANLVSDTIDGSEYVYDFWTYKASVGNVDYYVEMMVMEKGDALFSVTAQYPMEEAGEASPIVEAIMNSFILPGGGTG